MQELADELPDHSPRYVLLSYPLTLVRSAVNPARRLHTYTGDSHLVVCPCPMYYCTTSQSHAMRSYGCSMPERRNWWGTLLKRERSLRSLRLKTSRKLKRGWVASNSGNAGRTALEPWTLRVHTCLDLCRPLVHRTAGTSLANVSRATNIMISCAWLWQRPVETISSHFQVSSIAWK